MSNTKKILLFILSFFALIYVGLMQRYSDVQINKYEDFNVAKENKALEKGWVPSILPNSAYEIAETHDIDTNAVFGSFKYKEEDEKMLLEQLKLKSDINNTYEWKNFLFKIDTKENRVKFRNKDTK
jgi:hypothetical protein